MKQDRRKGLSCVADTIYAIDNTMWTMFLYGPFKRKQATHDTLYYISSLLGGKVGNQLLAGSGCNILITD